MPFDLNKRQQQILRATVRQYIATAEPVGSKTLVDGFNLNVSPATIRNGFATLEKAGFLYQPHPSAGRVPSDSGYRLYVDRLMQPSLHSGLQLQELFADNLDWEEWSLEAVLRRAAEILATLSGYVAMITLPQTRYSAIEHIQFVRVESTKIILIVLLDTHRTQSAIAYLQNEAATADRELVDRQLLLLANFLNSQLRGKSVAEIAALDWSKLNAAESEVGTSANRERYYVDLVSNLLADICRQSQSLHTEQIMIRGIAEVLRQPEFSQMQQVQTLLHLLESERERIQQLIFNPQLASCYDDDRQPKISIKIGSENSLEPMQICTLISTTYHQHSIPVGSVGLLGPKRMLYENAIALVRSAADSISAAIAHQ